MRGDGPVLSALAGNWTKENPPMHAFATLFLYRSEHALRDEQTWSS